MNKKWIIRDGQDTNNINQLAGFIGCSEILAKLLLNRGLDTNDKAYDFLYPNISNLHDSFVMKDMDRAVRRIRKAIKNKEKIVIYGDYDVDGATSTVILRKAIQIAGGDISYFIPERLKDGYGLRSDILTSLVNEGYTLLISVDTGVRAIEEVRHANKLGLDIIVTDHHLPGDKLPKAYAILNPKRLDCEYQNKNLAGVGVAFKLAQGLLSKVKKDKAALSLVKLVAIGTIADMVPLIGENRVIVKYGLVGLQSSTNPGLNALLDEAGLKRESVTCRDIGFKIAPKINAMGRMGKASPVIELFDAETVEQAQTIVKHMKSQNESRRDIQADIDLEIKDIIEKDSSLVKDDIIVLSGKDWHRGVVGIIASRVVDKYQKPTLVISVDIEGIGVGSARSVNNFHLLDALASVGDLFDRYGGHAAAAGFTIKEENIDKLRMGLNKYAKETITDENKIPILNIDTFIKFSDINGELIDELKLMIPYGQGNMEPTFCSKAKVLSPVKILKEKHLKLVLGSEGVVFDALWWGSIEFFDSVKQGDIVDIVFTLDVNEWRGRSEIQLIVKDIKKQN